MAEVEIVQEFREVIDQVISGQGSQARSQRRSWPDMEKVAHFAELTYLSVDANEGWSSTLGRSEGHRWGVITPKMRFLGGYAGRMAIVSSESRPQILERRLSLDSPMSQIYIDTSREISDTDLMGSTVNWIKSPHFDNGATLGRLAQMTDEEIASIRQERQRLAKRAQNLQRDLESIRQMHAGSAMDCETIFLD